ncbi:MAG: bifunctional methylenetetrahydrofolate dehydrogenase/methenyltetrahydrofolate cyclohydrolase FolD [Negativicutes bacterium]
MSAKILDGKLIGLKIRQDVKRDVDALRKEHGKIPGLAVIIVGENPASKVYVKHKIKACEENMIYSELVELAVDIEQTKLLKVIEKLNQDNHVNGILVQLPLPDHINTELILKSITPSKDVDGFHPINAGNLFNGFEGLLPCTPHGVIKMLEMSGIPIEGKKAVIIGRSNIVGKPMAHLLLARNATVTICHSRTEDLSGIACDADILVAAIGKPNFVGAAMVKPGATVIDVGINRVGDKLVGDVDFEKVKEIAGAITPVPGGVGPLTIAMLLYNTVKAAKMKLGLE